MVRVKVVLFCGGLGTRLKEYSETIPKPMAEIGYRPILWYLMKYYASYGHHDFVLCLGDRGAYIKRYFMNYDEYLSNDFTIRKGGDEVELFKSDISDWNITFVDTGQTSNVGQRLYAVREHLMDDEMFLATYADGLTALNLDHYLNWFENTGHIASFLSVIPSASFHPVMADQEGTVKAISSAKDAELWVNGGFFAFRREIFDYMRPGEELVEAPFQRLIDAGELVTYRNPGFWACMDTFKEKLMFDDLFSKGHTPWVIW